jgi:hypothetical protein
MSHYEALCVHALALVANPIVANTDSHTRCARYRRAGLLGALPTLVGGHWSVS